MLRLKDGCPSKPRLGAICALVFHHTVVFLFLTHCCGGQSQVLSPSQPIVATVGDDIMLPCHLDPAVDATDLTVEWSRRDLNPRFVHVWRDGVELNIKKHPSYFGRTTLSMNKLTHGDISLKLYKVNLSDEGTYRCFIPTLGRESTVELVVGAISSLIISLMRTENNGDSWMVLQCKSKGWYPEPELLWLDGEGNLLSAGPTESFRGPDGLYTVSSRVTVEKRHSNSFTCRVQQQNINQTRETHIHVPDDFFSAPCNSAAHITISSVVVFISILVVMFVLWKWRQKQNSINITTLTTKPTTSNNTELPLLSVEKGEPLQIIAESMEIKHLDENKVNLNAQLKEVEEERKYVVGLVNLLMDKKKDMENQIHHLRLQLHGVKRQPDENQRQLMSMVMEIEQTENNGIKYSEEEQNKKECLDTITVLLDTEKKELEKKLQDTDTILKLVLYGVTIVTEKKKVLDNLREQINKQLDEIEELRD